MSEIHTPLSADEALRQLEAADATVRSVRSGSAGWSHITMLVGLGVASSISTVFLWALRNEAPHLIWAGITPLLLWIAALIAFGLLLSRGTKRGFGTRWTASIVVWAVLWVLTMTVPERVGDPLWLTATCAALLGATTLAGAVWEVRS